MLQKSLIYIASCYNFLYYCTQFFTLTSFKLLTMTTYNKPSHDLPHHEYEEICLMYGKDKTILARYADILLVHCTNKLLTIWVDDEGSLLRCQQMQSLHKFMEDAPPGLFFRYRRSWLINLDRIHKKEQEKLFFTPHFILPDTPYISTTEFSKILVQVNAYRRRMHGDG